MQPIRIIFYITFLLSMFLFPAFAVNPSDAATAPQVKSAGASDEILLRKTILSRENDSLRTLQQDITAQKKEREKKLADLQQNTVTDEMLEKARLAMESARVNVESAKLDLASQQRRIDVLQSRIQDIQNQLNALSNNKDKQAEAAAFRKKLEETKSIRTVEQQYLKILSRKLHLLQEKEKLATSWWQSVQAVYQKQQLLKHQESLDELKQRLKDQEEIARQESARLEKELASLKKDDPNDVMKRQLIKRRFEYIEESLDILRAKINLHAMKSRYDSLGLSGQLDSSPEKLKDTLGELQDMQAHLEPLVSVTSGKLEVVQQEWALLQKQYALNNISGRFFARQKKLLTDLIDQFSSLLNAVKAFQAQVNQDIQRVKAAYARSVKLSLTARQTLPTDIATWNNIITDLASLPKKLKLIFIKMTDQVLAGWKQANGELKIVFAALCLLLCLTAFLIGRLPAVKDIPASLELRFSARVRVITFELLRESRVGFLAGGVLIAAAWLFKLETGLFHILLLFTIVLFMLRLAIKLSYLIFVSPIVPASKHQPKLHRMVTIGLILGAVFVLLLGLANAGILSETLKSVIDRMFMLLLLLSVYFIMRLRALIISRIGHHEKSRLWIHMVEFASLSIPLTAFCAAIVGLAGYINLARFVAGQLVLFLAVIIIWLVARDLARDMLNHWKPQFEKGAPAPDSADISIATPLKRLLDLLFLGGFLWSLARIYGWNTGNAVDVFLKTWFNYPIIHLGSEPITFAKIAWSVFLLLLFIYLSSLLRHLVYLLMYRNVEDRGLRNSLSIFTQYAVLVAGAFTVMHTMGLNLTSLTVFAGALGVGIGFGLQNIANNLISGLIILAERPVRMEDWVSIGDNQGIISRIGMRSLVLTTWDNQDVIIPNADLITSPVTNWTLSDNLIRTILQVGIRYQDDPHRAQEVILDAVSMVPAVSLEKKPKVYLSEFADSSVNFRVDYYSALDSQHGRNGVKSTVMFAIWDALKDADIGIPFPQQDIYIKELPQENIAVPSATYQGPKDVEHITESPQNSDAGT
jgi:potassium efflux system protein